MDCLTFLSQHVPLFSGMDEATLTPLAQGAELKKFESGQAIVRAGMTIETVCIVAAGKVGVYAKVPGQGVAKVVELGSGEIFGEASIFERTVAGATVKAESEGATILMITEDSFRTLMAGQKKFIDKVRALIDARRQPLKKNTT
jgi:CRP-like cAMP-binding protein